MFNSVNQDPSATGFLGTQNKPQQRRLPASGLTQQTDELTFSDVKVDLRQYGPQRRAVCNRKILNLNESHFGQAS
jgi:hypothetical protein